MFMITPVSVSPHRQGRRLRVLPPNAMAWISSSSRSQYKPFPAVTWQRLSKAGSPPCSLRSALPCPYPAPTPLSMGTQQLCSQPLSPAGTWAFLTKPGSFLTEPNQPQWQIHLCLEWFVLGIFVFVYKEAFPRETETLQFICLKLSLLTAERCSLNSS